jgi:hypothetical protein
MPFAYSDILQVQKSKSIACKIACIFFLQIASTQIVFSQSDSTKKVSIPASLTHSSKDTFYRFFVKKPIPKRAGLYSACIPGLGQLYNRQYWKVGLTYAGVAIATGFYISNYREYNKYRKIYIQMIDNNPNTPNTYENYTQEDVKYLRDGYRRFLEYTVIGTTVGYLMNILDAFISAHLKSFDNSKDLSFHFHPILQSNRQAGLGLTMQIH